MAIELDTPTMREVHAVVNQARRLSDHKKEEAVIAAETLAGTGIAVGHRIMSAEELNAKQHRKIAEFYAMCATLFPMTNNEQGV